MAWSRKVTGEAGVEVGVKRAPEKSRENQETTANKKRQPLGQSC